MGESLRNLTTALAGGASVASVLDAIKEREDRRRELRVRLGALDVKSHEISRT
jgi:hypothetical protein